MKSKIYTTKHKKECFICFCNNNQMSLLSKYITKKNCNCDGYIHKTCLLKWTSLKNTCPICRSCLNIEDEDLKNYNQINQHYNENAPDYNIVIGRGNGFILLIFIFISYLYKVFFILLSFSFLSIVIMVYYY